MTTAIERRPETLNEILAQGDHRIRISGILQRLRHGFWGYPLPEIQDPTSIPVWKQPPQKQVVYMYNDKIIDAPSTQPNADSELVHPLQPIAPKAEQPTSQSTKKEHIDPLAALAQTEATLAALKTELAKFTPLINATKNADASQKKAELEKEITALENDLQNARKEVENFNTTVGALVDSPNRFMTITQPLVNETAEVMSALVMPNTEEHIHVFDILDENPEEARRRAYLEREGWTVGSLDVMSLEGIPEEITNSQKPAGPVTVQALTAVEPAATVQTTSHLSPPLTPTVRVEEGQLATEVDGIKFVADTGMGDVLLSPHVRTALKEAAARRFGSAPQEV